MCNIPFLFFVVIKVVDGVVLPSTVPVPYLSRTVPYNRPWLIMPVEKLAEFGTFSGKFHACLVCG